MNISKKLIFAVLVLQLSFILSGCVVVLNNNFGSNIRVSKSNNLSDATVAKDYDLSIEKTDTESDTDSKTTSRNR